MGVLRTAFLRAVLRVSFFPVAAWRSRPALALPPELTACVLLARLAGEAAPLPPCPVAALLPVSSLVRRAPPSCPRRFPGLKVSPPAAASPISRLWRPLAAPVPPCRCQRYPKDRRPQAAFPRRTTCVCRSRSGKSRRTSGDQASACSPSALSTERPARFLKPKKRGPDQWAPVISRATIVSDR